MDAQFRHNLVTQVSIFVHTVYYLYKKKKKQKQMRLQITFSDGGILVQQGTGSIPVTCITLRGIIKGINIIGLTLQTYRINITNIFY